MILLISFDHFINLSVNGLSNQLWIDLDPSKKDYIIRFFFCLFRTCDKCKATFAGADIDAKVKKFESDIDDITTGNAEELEKLLRRMRYFLHENHYWILDVKRKLIDIYGNKPGFELYKIPKVSRHVATHVLK